MEKGFQISLLFVEIVFFGLSSGDWRTMHFLITTFYLESSYT